MKKYLLLLVAVAMATSASAQFYVSASGGVQMGSAGILTGTSLNADQSKATNHYGSYGEGTNYQIRTGYMFNKMFGVEMSLAYLHGADQIVDSYKNYYTTATFPIPGLGNSDPATLAVNDVTKAIAHGRAYGLSASLVYNFNEHVYGKFGAITKVGGKTEASGTNVVNVTLTENVYAPAPAPAGTIAIPAGTPVKTVTTDVNQDFHGRFPLGFIAAFGYKYSIGENLNLFAELEYLGINVTRDYSKYTKFTSTEVNHLTNQTTTTTLADLPASMRKITYVDTLSTANTDPSKALSSVVAYSSFGINFGITYTFGSKKESKN
jgi:hypothetical protein